VPARLTTKPFPRRPVLPGNMTTLRTGLARVRRINGNHGNSSQQRLVLDIRALLVERPGMQSCSLSATGRYPLADSLEVFQGDPTSGALRLLHDCLADPVVDISPETSLFAGNLSKLPLGSLGALLLEVSASVGVPASYLLKVAPRVRVAIGIRGEIHDPEIDSQKIVCGPPGLHFNFAGDNEKPLARLCSGEIDFSDTRLQHLAMTLVALEGHLDAPVERPDGDVCFAPGQKAWIVGLCPMTSELPGLGTSTHLVRIRNFGDAPDRSLGAETELRAHVAVDGFLDGDLVEDAEGNGLFGDPGARFVASLQGGLEECVLLLRGKQPDLHNEAHGS